MTLYSNMKFPPYVYREYPKEIKRADGSTVIVNNQREELNAMAEAPPAVPHPVVAERDELATQVAKEQEEKAKLAAGNSALSEELKKLQGELAALRAVGKPPTKPVGG